MASVHVISLRFGVLVLCIVYVSDFIMVIGRVCAVISSYLDLYGRPVTNFVTRHC